MVCACMPWAASTMSKAPSQAAMEHDLEIIPIVNKVDLPSAMPEEVEDQIIELLGCKREEIIRASGKKWLFLKTTK